MLKDLEPSKDYDSYIQENIRDLLQLTITLDRHLISAKDIIDFLTKKGPCYYEEMALKFGARLKYDTSSGLPKFLKELCSKGIVEKIKEGMNKSVFFNPFIHEHEKLAQFKSDKYTEKIYQNLADGKPKSTRKISETLSVSFGYANRLLNELKKTRDWLGHEKIRGESYQDVWFRNDTISTSITELLEEMKENRILERVKFCIKEPKTLQEVEKELGLSEKIVYTSLKKLVETGLAFKEKISNQRNASSNPSVYCLKSDDPLADELHRLKAIFKSTTPKYGEKIYKHFMSHSLSNRRKIMKNLNISANAVSNLLKSLKRYGLVDRTEDGWYVPEIIKIKKPRQTILEYLKKIGKVLFDIQREEDEYLKKDLGCPIKTNCANYKETPPKKFKKSISKTICDKSYKDSMKKTPLTFQERYYSCLDYRKYVVEKVERETKIIGEDLDYLVSSLLLFSQEPCRFQNKCIAFKTTESKDKCTNKLTQPERLSNCHENYGQFISKIIFAGYKKKNLKNEMYNFSQQLTNTIKVITLDGIETEITRGWNKVKNDQYFEIVIGNKRYGFNSEKTFENIVELTITLANDLVKNIETTPKLQVKETFIQQLSVYLENLKNQYPLKVT